MEIPHEAQGGHTRYFRGERVTLTGFRWGELFEAKDGEGGFILSHWKNLEVYPPQREYADWLEDLFNEQEATE